MSESHLSGDRGAVSPPRATRPVRGPWAVSLRWCGDRGRAGAIRDVMRRGDRSGELLPAAGSEGLSPILTRVGQSAQGFGLRNSA